MTFAVANVLIGLQKYSPNIKADLIIFHNDFTEKDKRLLNKISPCSFIDYEFPIEITKELKNSSFERYSKLAFSRYECFNLLDKYKQALWIDIDILIQKDISRIFNYSKTGISLYKELIPLQECFLKEIEGYKMSSTHYNSGILLLSDKLQNYKEMSEWLYQKTIELGEHLNYADQGVINLLLQFFNLDVDELDKKFNFHPTHKGAKDAVVIHPYSPQKFWKWYEKAYHFKEWDSNYKKWLKMGGSCYTGPKYMIGERWLKANIDTDFPNPWRQTRDVLKLLFKRKYL